MGGLFVTGTDTDCGKTLLSVALMQRLQQAGLQVAAMKPVAAGAELIAGQAVNRDAWLLQQQASRPADYRRINPYLFEPAIAPHLAAAGSGIEINGDVIVATYQQLAADADITIVEGAGGWRVPLNDNLDISDLPRLLRIPVVLVVGLKLGCINHARLTSEVIRRDGVELVGWIGNQLEVDMPALQGNIDALTRYLDAPCLGIVPFLPGATPQQAASYLNIAVLL